jgi:DUF1680 family protein
MGNSAAFVVDTSRSPRARLRPVSVGEVRLTDSFWEPRRRINQQVTIPSQYEHCEKTGRIDNFRRASGRKQCDFVGIYFNDSDVYKWLEAAARSLASEPDETLRATVDHVIDEIAAAQQPDGYLNTYFMFDLAKERWSNLKDKHELYCAGHLIQAAVAHHRATGDEKLLSVATKLAGHICRTFGPPESGRRPGTCGHEGIEMALIELSRETGHSRYLDQAKYFLDARGHGLIGGSAYHQDHKPVRELERVTGHAVRMVYLACGMSDLCLETEDAPMRAALDRIWSNMTQRQMYVTGGIGSRWDGEAFGRDWELPNERAYTETCAAIGSIMWNWRMLHLAQTPQQAAKYADLLELTLYNGFLSGLSLDGASYFYQNPLADDGTHRRQAWFGCACCPPNVARMLASLPGYFYSAGEDGAWVHLYGSNSADVRLPDGRQIKLSQKANYPWEPDVAITVETAGRFALHVRVPGWCEGAAATVGGERLEWSSHRGSYVRVEREWKAGDVLHLHLPMPLRFMESHPHVAENVGRVALMRGPIVYCAEAVDNPNIDLRDIRLMLSEPAETKCQGELLAGVTTIRATAKIPPQDWGGVKDPYRPAASAVLLTGSLSQSVVFVPYYAWANREPGQMLVWVRQQQA